MCVTDNTAPAALTAALPEQRRGEITPRLTLLFAVAVGTIVINLFAPQTLVGLIGPGLGLPPGAAGLVAMATLLGYAGGLFLLVPMADLFENRGLILRMLSAAIVAGTVAMLSPSATLLLPALVTLGAACSAIQILVPTAAAMASPERRGRTIGDVMSGVMVGILLSRPIASTIADAFGWRAFYGVSTAALVIIAAVLAASLPRHQPARVATYPALIGSLYRLLREEPVLRRRALTASLSMAAFSLFWTTVALRLALPPFDLGQRGIALFALAGAGGAAVTPIFGRAGDRGWTRGATIASHLILVLAAALAGWAGTTTALPAPLALALLGIGAVCLDIGVTGNQTLGRREVNLLRPEARGRINGLFVGLFFVGGAIGSLIAGLAWVGGGWALVTAVTALFGVAALGVDGLTRRR